MRAPRILGALTTFIEAIDALPGFGRRAQRFGQTMRRRVKAPRETARVGGRIVEDADQRLVPLCQRPGGAEARFRFVLDPKPVLAEEARAR